MAEIVNNSVAELMTCAQGIRWFEYTGAVDTTPPTFAGITGVSVVGDSVRLTWDAATDDVTAISAIQYEVHFAVAPGGVWQTRLVVPATMVLPFRWSTLPPPVLCTLDVGYLAPGYTYYFRVRAKDEAGNVDTNTVEMSVYLPGEGSTTTYYLMRGYRTLTNDYETWVAIDSPNSNNPSGQPIINTTIQAQW